MSLSGVNGVDRRGHRERTFPYTQKKRQTAQRLFSGGWQGSQQGEKLHGGRFARQLTEPEHEGKKTDWARPRRIEGPTREGTERGEKNQKTWGKIPQTISKAPWGQLRPRTGSRAKKGFRIPPSATKNGERLNQQKERKEWTDVWAANGGGGMADRGPATEKKKNLNNVHGAK